MFVAGLAACWQFAELSDELAQLRRDCRKWQRDIDREVKEHKKNAFALIRGLSPRTKAEMLERTNAVLQRRWRAPDPVDLFLEEHGSDLQQMLQLFDIRSDHGDSRPHTAFMRAASTWFYSRTKQWHDGTVATLTDIAFPDREATSIDMVRSARRGMHPSS